MTSRSIVDDDAGIVSDDIAVVPHTSSVVTHEAVDVIAYRSRWVVAKVVPLGPRSSKLGAPMTSTTRCRPRVAPSRAHVAALIALAAGAAALTSLSACGGGGNKGAATPASSSSAAADEPTGSPLTVSSAAAASASADTTPDTTPLAQVLITDNDQIAKLFQAANAAPAATPKADGAKGNDPLAKGIRDAAKRLPPGMKPEGAMATGTVKAKEHLQTDVTLQPGKCYSIVGFSQKVKDLDLFLLLAPGILSGQDLTDDNKPIIGGPPQPMCPTSSTAVTYKLDIFADSGSGDV